MLILPHQRGVEEDGIPPCEPASVQTGLTVALSQRLGTGMCKLPRISGENGRTGQNQKRMECTKLAPVRTGGAIMAGESSARGRRREMAMTNLFKKAKVEEDSL